MRVEIIKCLNKFSESSLSISSALSNNILDKSKMDLTEMEKLKKEI